MLTFYRRYFNCEYAYIRKKSVIALIATYREVMLMLLLHVTELIRDKYTDFSILLCKLIKGFDDDLPFIVLLVYYCVLLISIEHGVRGELDMACKYNV